MKSKIIKTAGTEKYPFACVIKIGYYVTDRICDEDKAQQILGIGRILDNMVEIKKELNLKSVNLRIIAQ